VLFELAEDSSLEEDLAEADPVELSVELDLVEDLEAGGLDVGALALDALSG